MMRSGLLLASVALLAGAITRPRTISEVKAWLTAE